MFFGDRGVNAIDICTQIARGALALGARKHRTGIASSWHYIGTDIDWLSVNLQHEYENENDVFEKMHPFPEYFVNTVRYEPMSKSFDGSNLNLIKGKDLDTQLFKKEVTGYSKWKRVIGFRFNEHA